MERGSGTGNIWNGCQSSKGMIMISKEGLASWRDTTAPENMKEYSGKLDLETERVLYDRINLLESVLQEIQSEHGPCRMTADPTCPVCKALLRLKIGEHTYE